MIDALIFTHSLYGSCKQLYNLKKQDIKLTNALLNGTVKYKFFSYHLSK